MLSQLQREERGYHDARRLQSGTAVFMSINKLNRGIAKRPNPKPVTPWVKPAIRIMRNRNKYTVINKCKIKKLLKGVSRKKLEVS